MASTPVETPTLAYRHVFRRLGAEQPRAVIEHGLGRFPVVDVYELLDIPTDDAGGRQEAVQFFLYYGHDELDSLLRRIGGRLPRGVFGTPLAQLLAEYRVEYEDDDSLGDVVNDFLDAFFAQPGADEMAHRVSPWIDGHRDRIVREMMDRDEWDDVRWAVRPAKLLSGGPLTIAGPAGAATVVTPLVTVEQLSYNALAVSAIANLGTVPGPNNQPVPREFIDVMLVMAA